MTFIIRGGAPSHATIHREFTVWIYLTDISLAAYWKLSRSCIKLLLMQTEHPATADTLRSSGLYALVLLW